MVYEKPEVTLITLDEADIVVTSDQCQDATGGGYTCANNKASPECQSFMAYQTDQPDRG